MKAVKQILFTVVLATGLSCAVFAQKDDQKKPPPKDPPPKINPGDKPPKGNPPRNDGDKPKKPGYAIEIGEKANRIVIA